METLQLPGTLADAIVQHARACYPDEACGLVVGQPGICTEIYPAQNVAPNPRTSFEVDVDTLARQVDLDDLGLDLVAIYHSHPHGPAQPSEVDRRQAAYEVVYIICSLEDPERPSLRGFRFQDGKMWEVCLRQGLDT